MFSIMAQTRKGWGEAADALVVTTEKRGKYSSHIHMFQKSVQTKLFVKFFYV